MKIGTNLGVCRNFVGIAKGTHFVTLPQAPLSVGVNPEVCHNFVIRVVTDFNLGAQPI